MKHIVKETILKLEDGQTVNELCDNIAKARYLKELADSFEKKALEVLDKKVSVGFSYKNEEFMRQITKESRKSNDINSEKIYKVFVKEGKAHLFYQVANVTQKALTEFKKEEPTIVKKALETIVELKKESIVVSKLKEVG